MGKRIILISVLVFLTTCAHAAEGVFSQATKVNSGMISIERVIPESRIIKKFTREELERKKAKLLAQKEEFIAKKNKEIAEIDAYLAECDKLGITSRPDGLGGKENRGGI